MLRRLYLATTLVAVIGTAPAISQPGRELPKGTTGYDIPLPKSPSRTLDDPKPVYKYELKPEHGEFLVVVKTFQGGVAGEDRGEAKKTAEGLAEYIRSECRLYAYVHESGWAKRQQRNKEKAAVIDAARKHYRNEGWTEESIDNEIKKIVKLARIPDEYSVLVAPGKGTLKTMDEALTFAKYMRENLKAPPADFCEVSSAGAVGAEKEQPQRKSGLQNPFLHVMPGQNPTIPKKEVGMQRPKADDFLLSLNSGKPYSLIHKTKKDFTLVVQVYGTKFGQFQRPGDVVPASVKTDGELLERAAQQAELVAKVLRQQKPPYDAYVLHTRYESFVCVGEYDSKDDPELLAKAKELARWQLRKDGKTGEVVDTFMEKPLPAMIPRP